MSERETVSVRISPDVWKEAKKFAVEKDMAVSQLVEIALIHELRR
jgi:antitoxin component of RelBE/YafQ-DinJ toxin-antitoxin module